VRNKGDLPEKFDPSHPALQVTQCRWNRHGSTGHLWLAISVPH